MDYGLSSRWRAFAEYGYMRFGAHRVDLPCHVFPACGTGGTDTISIDVRENLQVLKTGIGYRF